MSDRERLIELLRKSGASFENALPEDIADYLLAKGVIVAPMPMAEWLRQELTEHVHKRCMEEL
jgi:hypothetical protein